MRYTSSPPLRRTLPAALLGAGILLAAAAPAFGATYYVAPISTSCSPAARGSGTLEDPWTNLYDALSLRSLRPGDTLQLRGGTYRNRYSGFANECGSSENTGVHTVMPLSVAGTEASPIVIENYPGETVTIDGTDADMNGAAWTPCCSNAWQTTAFNVGTAGTAQVWVNPEGPREPGRRLRFNRLRTCEDLKPGEFTVSGGTTLSLRLPDDGDVNKADVRMSCEIGDCAAYPIRVVAGAAWLTVRENPAGGGFFVKYGYYNVFVDGGASNLTFDGLELVAAGGRDYGSCLRVWNGSHVSVRNGVCREAMGEGIALYGGGPGGGGVAGIQLSRNSVESMEIFDTGRAWADGGAFGNNLGMGVILKNCGDCAVRKSRVGDSFGSAILVTTSETAGMQSNNAVIERNTLWNFGYLNRTFGGRNTAGIQIEPQTEDGIRGGTIRNNEIYGAAAHDEWSNGIRVSAAGWTPVRDLVIVNNSMNDLNGACIDLQENPAPATIRNNAMSNCSTQGPTCGGGGRCNLYVDSSPHVHGNNTYWAADPLDVVVHVWGEVQYTRTDVALYEPSAVQAEPLYVSPSDLRLQDASLLIDAASVLDCPAEDHDGVPRPIHGACDVGAFECGTIVQIDIIPGAFPNAVRLGSGAVVPVAIFSDARFDATTVDPATITLESAPVRLRGNGTPMASTADINGDGRPDLLVHVGASALQISEGDTQAVLMGKTRARHPIQGSDSIRVVP